MKRELIERAKESILTGSLYKYDATENSCTCPYRRRTGKTCKHMVAIRILKSRKELEKQEEWREFFQKLDTEAVRFVEDSFPEF